MMSDITDIDLTAEIVSTTTADKYPQLPFLAEFRRSVARCQAFVGDGNLRSYCRDIVANQSFSIVSPITGVEIQSGASLVLKDKCVVFSFPDEPGLFIGTGDMGRGYPICSAFLPDLQLWIELEATDWGYAKRHIPETLELIAELSWSPSVANGPVVIVTGDMNYAHHAWNQLSALHDLIQSSVQLSNVEFVTTHEPFGSIARIFPEIAHAQMHHTSDALLPSYNRQGRVFVALGGVKIRESLVHRLLDRPALPETTDARALDEALSKIAGPVLWMSVRTRNRTATNQRQLLAALGRAFLTRAPNGAIVIDGHSVSTDVERPAPDMMARVEADRVDAAAILEDIAAALPSAREKIHFAIGLPIIDSIFLGRRSTIYFAHHGTVQHKVGWFTPIPGMVHCNRSVIETNPAQWVAAQSDVAVTPAYLAPEEVRDVVAEEKGEYDHLLKVDNYTIVNVDLTVDKFMNFAELNGCFSVKEKNRGIIGLARDWLVRKYPNEMQMQDSPGEQLFSEDNMDQHLVLSDGRVNRHIIAAPEIFEPEGVLYTNFFGLVDKMMQPKSYFEIGTERGRSVREFKCDAVCVDPNFILESDVIGKRRSLHFFQMPSDDFFAAHDLKKIFGAAPDVCFLDGMHLAEYLLRDFINTERSCTPRSIIFMHDCLPSNERMALRTHKVGDPEEGKWQHAWTGDVWKMVPILKKYRPDLQVFVLDCAPTGLIAVTNLDPTSTVLQENYQKTKELMRNMDLKEFTIRRLWEQFPVLSSQSLMEHPEDLSLFLG
jgi:hypothetical protein